MLEKELEKKLVDKVKRKGGRAYKFISPGNSGVPDRLVVLPGGRVGFAEMKKSPQEKPTPLQKAQIRFLKKLGCFAEVVDSEKAIDDFIKKLENRRGADV